MHAPTLLLRSLPTLLLVLPALATPTPAAPQQSINIRARIDGLSRLVLDDDTAQWHHLRWAAPGRLDCDIGNPIAPTFIDGQEWWPQWPDAQTCENRDCDCDSDVSTGLLPRLPDAEFQVSLVPIQVRSFCGIVEFPTAANGYRVVIEFDDSPPAADSWYEVNLVLGECGAVSSYCTSTPNSTGQAATIQMSGNLSVAVNQATLQAFGCPPNKLGLFFYGRHRVQRLMADGFLCISPFAPGLFRLRPLDYADGAGHVVRALDFDALTGSGQILGGSTWCFQYWYRDQAAGGTGTNLTDAVQVTFCP